MIEISQLEIDKKLGFDYHVDFFAMHNEFNGKKDVVYSVRGFIVSYDKNDNGKSFRKLFVIEIPTNDLTNFIDYKELTKEQVHGWIEKYLSETSKINIKRELYEEHFPSTRLVRPKF